MTNERIPERIPAREQARDSSSRPDPAVHDRAPARDKDRDHGRDRDRQQGQEDSPWLREGADAPDAADIADPERQR
jgi:hypothetical protein